jgi:hypothetical protein
MRATQRVAGYKYLWATDNPDVVIVKFDTWGRLFGLNPYAKKTEMMIRRDNLNSISEARSSIMLNTVERHIELAKDAVNEIDRWLSRGTR